MNLNNFTIKSQEAVQQAVQLVQKNNQQVIEPVHLLKAVIMTGESVTNFLFQKLGVNIQNLNMVLDRQIESYPKVSGGEPYLSSESNAVLQKAIDYSGKMGDQYVSLEHIILALFTVKSTASQILKDAGVTENELKKAIEELPTHGKVGYVSANHNAVEDYVAFAVSTIDCRLDGMKIAVDCANGASYETAFKALNKLGANVEAIHNTPDGVNINHMCGSTHMESLQAYVTSIGADIGIAFDGDADRMLAVDENGKLIDGDQIMAACAKFMRDNGTLKQNTLVATVMSNLGLFMAGEKIGINIPRTKVGDRYVLEEMLAKGYNIGGEQSGHIIFLDHNTTGDGLVSALQFLSVLKKTGMKASEAASIVTVMPQVLRNAVVKLENKNSYMENEEIAAACKALEDEFAGEGRVLIRPSGTEPLVRVMIEGKDEEYITKKAEELAELIEKILG